jgi:hypothetical protein
MSATPYEPLRAVPPHASQQERMGWLLRARRWARRMAEGARAAAVSVMDTVSDPQLLRSAVSRLREAALRTGRRVLSALQGLGRRGGLAAAAAVITSDTGREFLAHAARTISSAVTSVGTTVASLVDGGLRRLGGVGKRTADWLSMTITGLRRRLQPAVTAVRWFARASHPSNPLGQLVGTVSRSYLLHLLLSATVRNRWLRGVVELVLIPAIADSAALAWLRRVVAQARVRAERLRRQADVVADAPSEDTSTSEARFVAGDEVDDDGQQESGLANRAERRAAKRQNRGPQQQ